MPWLICGNCRRMNVSLEWLESLRQGRAYSVTLPPAFGRRQGYRIMPCPFGDFLVTPRRPNQSCIVHTRKSESFVLKHGIFLLSFLGFSILGGKGRAGCRQLFDWGPITSFISEPWTWLWQIEDAKSIFLNPWWNKKKLNTLFEDKK